MVTLDKISLADFIELCDGNYDSVGGDNKVALSLIGDYNEIVNKEGVTAKVLDQYTYEKARCKIGLLAVCRDLLTMFDAKDSVDEAFTLAKMQTYATKEKYIKFIDSEMARQKLNIKRWEKKHEDDVKEEVSEKRNVRDEFSSQIASIMAFFKMSIDIHTTNAMVYAHLVNQAHRQSVEMQKEINKAKHK